MAYTTIDDPSAHFQTVLYTGNSSDNAITNDGNSDLQPDLLWVKSRAATDNHMLFDSSRGFNGDNDSLYLEPNNTDAEAHDDDNHLKSFNSDGFTMQAGSSRTNNNTVTFVAWQWKANGGTTTSVSASGTTLASTHQTDSTSKFCIMTWTGSGTAGHKVTHGLGSVPKLIIVKKRSGADSWAVYHHKNTSAPETDYLHLDETIATTDSVDRWNDTAPTSTLITLGDAGVGNASSATYVGYCWDEVQGYSKIGSYTGNGSEDGPFVYLGFKPQWILFKNAGAAEEWVLQDTTRNPNNPVTINMRVDSNIAEADASSIDFDFLSNGFKNRSDQAQVNSSGVTYIYMAFAEHPFVSSKGVPVTAK